MISKELEIIWIWRNTTYFPILKHQIVAKLYAFARTGQDLRDNEWSGKGAACTAPVLNSSLAASYLLHWNTQLPAADMGCCMWNRSLHDFDPRGESDLTMQEGNEPLQKMRGKESETSDYHQYKSISSSQKQSSTQCSPKITILDPLFGSTWQYQ